jgi:hypothetical protein
MTYSKIVIDGNNLYHRNFNAFNTLKRKIGNKIICIGGVYGFLKSLNYLQKYSSPKTKFYILWDNHDSKVKIRTQMDEKYLKRSEIDSAYKVNRNKEDKVFYRGLDILRSILFVKNNDYYDIQIEDYEADDVVKHLIDNFNFDRKVLVVSEDMDWARNISEHVNWLAKNKIYDIKRFEKEYGFKPINNNVAIYKAIKGDKSDHIPVGIKNLPIELVHNVIEDFEDIYDFLDNYYKCEYLNKNWKEKITENIDRIRLNYQLVDFIPINNELIEQNTIKCIRNDKKLSSILKSLGIKPLDIGEKIEYNNFDLFNFKSKFERI